MGSHYLPQEYLRGFQVPVDPGMIWVYDKKAKSSKKLPIKVVAQEAGYYDPQTEQLLSTKLEGPAHAILGELRDGREVLEPQERATLAHYIAAMVMRVPKRRRKAREMVPSVINDLVDKFKSDLKGLEDNTGTPIEKYFNEAERVRNKYLKEPPQEVLEQVRSPWPTERIVKVVHDMPWRIVKAPSGSYFLTGDSPAFFFEGLGLGSPKAELAFPLASNLALFGCWQGRKETLIHISAKSALVKELNRRLASGAERFVFYHEDQPWVSTIAEKKNPYLCEIQW